MNINGVIHHLGFNCGKPPFPLGNTFRNILWLTPLMTNWKNKA